ncbi:protein of unknown function [Burkholderia multivorans]
MERRKAYRIRNWIPNPLEYRYPWFVVGFQEIQNHSIFSNKMKLLRTAVGAIAGAIMVTFVCWSGLYLFGVFVLHRKGSLFDTNPQAANLFFAGWFIAMVAASTIGGWRGYVSGQNRVEKNGQHG